MPKRPKRPHDPMQLAKLIGDMATGQVSLDPAMPPDTPVIEARRKGGLKGGKARAKKLSGRKRTVIARKAAQSRWHERKGSD